MSGRRLSNRRYSFKQGRISDDPGDPITATTMAEWHRVERRWLAQQIDQADQPVSLITFVAYALDKRAARLGRPRTPESTLHVPELLGGWPGAFWPSG
jgi:hypothetical protein